jgi:hypothetical protein
MLVKVRHEVGTNVDEIMQFHRNAFPLLWSPNQSIVSAKNADLRLVQARNWPEKRCQIVSF